MRASAHLQIGYESTLKLGFYGAFEINVDISVSLAVSDLMNVIYFLIFVV